MGELILEEHGVRQRREHMCDGEFYMSTSLVHTVPQNLVTPSILGMSMRVFLSEINI